LGAAVGNDGNALDSKERKLLFLLLFALLGILGVADGEALWIRPTLDSLPLLLGDGMVGLSQGVFATLLALAGFVFFITNTREVLVELDSVRLLTSSAGN
jgi:hypothetical protein